MIKYKKSPDGVYIFKSKDKREYYEFSHLECDICKEKVNCLSQFDMSKVIWTWASKYENPSLNSTVKNRFIEICGNCLNNINKDSIICIKITLPLAEALVRKNEIPKKIKRVSKKLKEGVQKEIC